MALVGLSRSVRLTRPAIQILQTNPHARPVSQRRRHLSARISVSRPRRQQRENEASSAIAIVSPFFTPARAPQAFRLRSGGKPSSFSSHPEAGSRCCGMHTFRRLWEIGFVRIPASYVESRSLAVSVVFQYSADSNTSGLLRVFFQRVENLGLHDADIAAPSDLAGGTK